jgi:hypothetical protein
MKPHLTIDLLREEAAHFAEIETVYDERKRSQEVKFTSY